jgi:hypothetical protein
VYDRRVTVDYYHHFSCGAAARVASATSDAYERGLPLADYPPPPPGVPGGQSRTFKVHTRKYGTYTCRMTERGSDFIQARCRQGVRFSSFVVEGHWWLHGQCRCRRLDDRIRRARRRVRIGAASLQFGDEEVARVYLVASVCRCKCARG